MNKIAVLYDEFRRTFARGTVVMTAGVAALDEGAIARVVNRVQQFDEFTSENDPHREHDFGNFEINGEKLFWKIDYYDKSMEYGSEDAADPEQTTRVMTIMLASEY